MTQSCRCHAVSGLIPCATLGSHLASGVAHLYPGSDVVCRDCLKLVMNISSFVQRVNPSGGLPPNPQMDDPNAKHPSGPDSPDPSDHHSGHSSDPDSDQPDGSDGGSIEPETAGDLFHRLGLGGSAHAGDRDADIHGGPLAGKEEIGLKVDLAVGDRDHVGGNVGGDFALERLDDREARE